MAQNYWGATNEIKLRHGGINPTCPACGGEMFPEDDHGRFICFACPGKPSTNLADFPRLTMQGGRLGVQNHGETEKTQS